MVDLDSPSSQTLMEWALLSISVITACASLLTWRVYVNMNRLMAETNLISKEMVGETRRSREEAASPLLIVNRATVEQEVGLPSRYAVSGSIRNAGLGAALNVSVRVEGSNDVAIIGIIEVAAELPFGPLAAIESMSSPNGRSWTGLKILCAYGGLGGACYETMFESGRCIRTIVRRSSAESV